MYNYSPPDGEKRMMMVLVTVTAPVDRAQSAVFKRDLEIIDERRSIQPQHS
jgi:hypothetical protein